MMITAVYFQARPGVVFSDLLIRVPTGGRVLCNIWGRGSFGYPCRCGLNLTGQTGKYSESAARLVRWELRAAAIHRDGHVPLV